MSGLWMNNPATSEGKFPIVLRRDGTALAKPYMVIVWHDACAAAAFRAYADEAERLGWDTDYVLDIRKMADRSEKLAANPNSGSDPDAPRHRKDDPAILAWARSLGRPGA